MKTIDYLALSESAKKEVDRAPDEAGTPVARKAGRGYRISFVGDSVWDLFEVQHKKEIAAGVIFRVTFS